MTILRYCLRCREYFSDPHLNGMMMKPTYTLGDRTLGKPVEMADGSIAMELEIMGMKVRWPANKYALPDGSWGYM